MRQTNHKKHNAGFTLMEVIIVVAIISVLLGLGAVGVRQYLKDADTNERLAAAEIIFMSMQSQLVERQKEGSLGEFNERINAYAGTGKLYTLMDYSEGVVKEEGPVSRILAANKINFSDAYKKKHEGTKVVAVFYNGKTDRNTSLYDILFSMGVDDEYLNNKIVFEYNQTTGIVQAVFYSKEEGVLFSAASYESGNKTGRNNLLARDDDSLEEKLQGYYGLYETAELAEKIAEIIDNKVQLVNDDRVYLVFESSLANKENGHGPNVQVKIDGAGDYKPIYNVKWNNNGGNIKWDDTISTLLDSLGTHDTSDDTLQGYFFKMNGEHKALCIILVSSEVRDRMTALTKAGAFGLVPEKSEFYCQLINDGIIQESNTTNPIFADYDAKRDVYSISCVRHIMNMTRLDAIKQELNGGNRGDVARTLHYQVTQDINFCQYEREEDTILPAIAQSFGKTPEEMLKEASKNGNIAFLNRLTVENVRFNETNTNLTRHLKMGVFPLDFDRNVDLVSTSATVAKSIFKGTLESASVSDVHTISGIYVNAEEKGKWENGFVRTNEGVIQNLTFADAVILSQAKGGVVCGTNKGTLKNITVRHFLVCQEIVGQQQETKESPLKEYNPDMDVANGYIKFSGSRSVEFTPSFIGGLTGISEQPIEGCSGINGIIYAYDSVAGGLVGWSSYKSSSPTDYAFSNCDVINSFVIATAKVGGIVGHCTGSIDSCRNLIDNENPANAFTTDILAFRSNKENENRISIFTRAEGYKYDPWNSWSCRNIKPSVTAYRNNGRVGGIVAVTEGSISNCINQTTVLQYYIEIDKAIEGGNIRGVGGIAGIAFNETEPIKVTNCTNYGLVTVDRSRQDNLAAVAKFIGGITGMSSGQMENCENYAEIMGFNTFCVGGIAGGCTADMLNCRNYAPISGRLFIGGVAGAFTGSRMENCTNGAAFAPDGTFTYVETARVSADYAGWGGNYAYPEIVKKTEASPIEFRSFQNISITEGQCGRIGGLVGSCVAGTYDFTSKVFTRSAAGATLTGCYNAAPLTRKLDAIHNKAMYFGGIVGYSAGNVTMNDVRNFGNIDFTAGSCPVLDVGGILGYCVNGSVHMEQVFNFAESMKFGEQSISDRHGIGGIIGYTDCKSDTVTADDTTHLSVLNTVASTCTMEFSSGTRIKYIGGIMGGAYDNVQLRSVVADGEIKIGSTGIILERVGGVVGYIQYNGVFEEVSCNRNIVSKGGEIINVGGIAGFVRQALYMNNVHYGTAAINPIIKTPGKMSNCGGLVGSAGSTLDGTKAVTISNSDSYASFYCGEWAANMENTGGIIGIVGGSNNKPLLMLTSVRNYGSLVNENSAKIVNAGGIVGVIYGESILKDVQNGQSGAPSIIEAKDSILTKVGGVVGHIYGKATFEDIKNYAVIRQGRVDLTAGGVGGLGGHFESNVIIQGTLNENWGVIIVGSPNGEDGVGGIAGHIGGTNKDELSEIRNVVNHGDITILREYDTKKCVGGCIGKIQTPVYVENAINMGNILNGNVVRSDTIQFCAGILGRTTKATVLKTVKNMGLITTGGKMSQCGGLVGYADLEQNYSDAVNQGNLYAAANMSQTGGIVGYIVGAQSCTGLTNEGVLRTEGNMSQTGGITGYTVGVANYEQANNKGKLYAAGAVEYTGGIIGRADKKTTLISAKNVEGITAGSTLKNSGGIVGYVKEEQNYTDVFNQGALTANGNMEYVSGILGRVDVASAVNIIIKNATNEGAISGAKLYRVGGVLGYLKNIEDSKLTAENLRNYGAIAATLQLQEVGGLFGKIDDYTILVLKDSGNYAELSAKEWNSNNASTGGIAGTITSKDAVLENVENKGNISFEKGGKSIGGIIGRTFTYGNLYLKRVSNDGQISAPAGDMQFIGGILGSVQYGVTTYTTTIEDSINTGNILAPNSKLTHAGGIVGGSDSDKPGVFTCIRSTARCTIEGNGISQVGGLIGLIRDEGGSTINGTRNGWAEISDGEFAELNVTIIAHSGDRTKIGIFVGDSTKSNLVVCNYNFIGSVNVNGETQAELFRVANKRTDAGWTESHVLNCLP